ncbi:MAG: YkgJ family cysteine cluster protein [Rhodospirillales bacterium]
MTRRAPKSGIFDYVPPLEEKTTAIVAGALGAAADSGDGTGLEALVDAVTGFMEGLASDVARRQPPPRPIACKKGCAFCCFGTEVHASPPEVFRVAAHLDRRPDGKKKTALITRIADVAAAKAADRAKMTAPAVFPCPLLEAGRCSVYAARPLVCRGFNSYDAGTCERRKIGGERVTIEGYAHQDAIAQATLRGVQRGCAEVGRAGVAVDLAPALHIALTEPDARRRWMAGEDVFRSARARLRHETVAG